MKSIVAFMALCSCLLVSAAERAVAEQRGSAMITWPTQRYDANGLVLRNLVADVVIKTASGGQFVLDISGSARHLRDLIVKKERETLVIADTGQGHNDKVQISITMPREAPIETHHLIGSFSLDSTNGALTLGAAAAEINLGQVATAVVQAEGSSQLRVNQANSLQLSMGGSSGVEAGQVGSLQVQSSGSMKLVLQKLNGPAEIDMSGSGTAYIREGTANPLHLRIMGAGQFEMDGMAVNPVIEGMGFATVRLRAYSGQPDVRGMVQMRVGP